MTKARRSGSADASPADPGRAASRLLAGLALGLATLAGLAAIDVLIDRESAALIAPFVAAPLATSLLAGPYATLSVGSVALLAGIVSPLWNSGTAGSEDFYVRIAVIAVGTVFATLGAANRERAEARAARLRLLDAVGEVADGSLPLAETLRRVTEVIVPTVGDICAIDAVHAGRATRLAVRAAGREDAAEVEARFRRRPPSLPRWLLNVERDWRHIPRWLPQPDDEDLRRIAHSEEDFQFLRSLGICSSLVVPIAARDRNLGTLSLISAWSERRYSNDDVQFAQILASRVALALDNAGLFSDLESVERRMDTVMEIVDEAVLILDDRERILFANPAAARALGFPDTEASRGPLARIAERYAIRDEGGDELAPAVLGTAAASGEPRTVRLSDRAGSGERWLRVRSRPIAGAQGELLYVVSVLEDVTDVKRAEFRHGLIASMTELFAHATEYESTVHSAARLVVPAFADACSVSIRRAGAIEQTAFADRDPDREARREGLKRYPVGAQTPIARVIRTGEPILIAEVEESTMREVADDGEHLELIRSLGYGSVIVVPMTVGGSVFGALSFSNGVASRRFGPHDLEIATEIASRAALAIENARIAQERARIAELLQRELRPSTPPAVPGWEIETMYQPAGELDEVGGDFYEVFAVERGWAIVLGDVSGHGAAAASLTAEARHTIRTAGAVDPSPIAGLRLLDGNLRRRADSPLCTVAMLIVPREAPGRCEVEVVLAGHPHPLLVRGDEVAELGAPGPVLGAVEDPRWVAATTTVVDGDVIVLYTDGVIEARRSDGERFGLERLRACLAGCARAELAVARVRAELGAFLAAEPADDAALVVLRRSPGAGEGPAAGREARPVATLSG